MESGAGVDANDDHGVVVASRPEDRLAKAAKALKLPIVVTTTARDSMWGPTFPELVEALPGIDRSSVNAFDDARVARAIEATGRKKSFHLFKSV